MQRGDILHRPPFYSPRFATIRPGDSGPVDAVPPGELSGGSDMALPLSVICVGGTAGSQQE
jgi:hypothetical protein